MANIEYTPYIQQQLNYQPLIENAETTIPIIRGKQKPKEEIHLAPLPKTAEEPVIVETAPDPINWDDTTKEGKGRAARNYLMSKLGLSAEQASGLIGNFMLESGLNVNAENQAEKSGKNSSVNKNLYGIGIGQWTGARHTDFSNWVGQHGNTLQSQLDFAADEIQRKYPEFLQALRTAETPEEASDFVYAMYTAANHRNVNRDTLPTIIKGIENAYNKKHMEMYGRTFNGHSNARRKASRSAFEYKLGGVLKMQNAGVLYAPFNNQSNDRQSIAFAPKSPPKGYIKQFNLNDKPRTKDNNFDAWYSYVAQVKGINPNPDDPEHFYDYRGLYDQLVDEGKQYEVLTANTHFPDTYKRPGHETFSIESKYYKPGMIAGHWEGETYRTTPFSSEEMEARQQYAETRFKKGRVSSAGAKGAYQFMPATWAGLNKKYGTNLNIEDYNDNKQMRDLYIDDLMHNDLIRFANEPSRIALTYAAYNMGIGNLKKFIEKEQSKGIDVYNTWDWIDDLNPETKKYVNFIVIGIDGNGDLTSAAFKKALPNRFKDFPEANIK